MAELLLIRHGQASFGADNYDQLSKLGMQQAHILGEYLAAQYTKVQLVCGTLTRQLQTTQLCRTGANWPEQAINVIAGFNEFDHEDVIEVAYPQFKDKAAMRAHLMGFENPRSAFNDVFKASVEKWVAADTAEYRESYVEFCSRVDSALQQVMTQSQAGVPTLVFSSGGAIAVCLQTILGLSAEKTFAINEMIANTSVTRILFDQQGRVSLSYFNNFQHLELASSQVTYR